MKIEIEREDDGRWIAEVPDLPGVIVYGESRENLGTPYNGTKLSVIDRFRVPARPSFDGKSR
jgi:hypothetical protein